MVFMGVVVILLNLEFFLSVTAARSTITETDVVRFHKLKNGYVVKCNIDYSAKYFSSLHEQQRVSYRPSPNNVDISIF